MQDVEQMIEDCEARESRLTDWEAGFLDSVKEYWSRTGSLSSRQAEKLESIWERVTAKG